MSLTMAPEAGPNLHPSFFSCFLTASFSHNLSIGVSSVTQPVRDGYEIFLTRIINLKRVFRVGETVNDILLKRGCHKSSFVY